MTMFVKAGCIVLLCLSVMALAEPDVETEVDVPDEDLSDEPEDIIESEEEPEEPEELTPDSLSPRRTDIYTDINQQGDCSVKAATGDMITMEYTLYLPPRVPGANWKTDGQKIGGTDKDPRGNPRPIILTLGSKSLMMKGADDGIEGMCLNEDRSMILPVPLGFGDAEFGKANSQLVSQIEQHFGELPVTVLNVKLHAVVANGSMEYYWFWGTTYASQYGGQVLIGIFVMILFFGIYKIGTYVPPEKPKKEKLGKKGKKRA